MSTVLMPRPPFVDPDHYEVVDGVRVDLPPMGARETDIASLLASFLWPFVRSQRLGRVHTEMLYLIDAARDLQRRPDVSFVAAAKWPLDRLAPTESAWALVPDLAVEVVSPSNSGTEVQRKVREYFRSGVREVWVLHPKTRHLYVFQVGGGYAFLREADTLTSPVLPGFTVLVADLFRVPTPPAQAPPTAGE